jgi:hypothetical protein
MNNFIEVTRDEYLEFIRNYPNKLEFDCIGMCEPPLGSYNDFSDGKVWPESMVAKEVRDWRGQGGEIDNSRPGKFWRYYILGERQEPNKQELK